MSKVYVNGVASISPQHEDIFETGSIEEYRSNILPALNQDYKTYVKPMALRRMSKAVKMSLLTSKKALAQANIQVPEAIFVGTGQGCIQDTEKFLEQLLENDEGILSPTSFIQSTHNTIAGQLALELQCKGYNMTYTQNSVSFESALLDAILRLRDEEDIKNALVGGVEEIAKKISGFQYFDLQLKGKEILNLDLFNEISPGTITSEAASSFVLSSAKNSQSYAEIVDIHIQNKAEPHLLKEMIENFLLKNELERDRIDVVILGNNGDSRFDRFYTEIQRNLFPDKLQIGYKHLVGDNNSIASYAVWLASKILKGSDIPAILKLNHLNCDNPRYILIYNQNLGKNHGLILLKSL